MKAIVLVLLLSGCVGLQPRAGDNNPALLTECPEQLPAVTEPSFGETVKRAVEWAGIYHACRRAALTGRTNADGR